MRYDLAAMARRAGRRRSFNLPLIAPTKAQSDDLATIYMDAVRAWQTGAAHILAAYERALAVAQRDAATIRDDARATGSTVDSVAESINRLLLTLTPKLRDWAVRIDRWHRGRWIAGTLSAAGVDLQTVLGPDDARETLETVIARNVELVRNVSDQIRGRIADLVFRELGKRTAARDVGKLIDEAVKLGRDRSRRIAADQATKIAAALDAERQRQAGLTAWIWRWSHKLHGRPAHIARDGKRYTDETAPEDLPGELPYCGCRRQGVVDLD